MTVFGLQAEDPKNESTACISKLKTALQGKAMSLAKYFLFLALSYDVNLLTRLLQLYFQGIYADVRGIDPSLRPFTNVVFASQAVKVARKDAVLRKAPI